MSDPDNYKGISAIAFKPDHMSAHDEILSIGYFGGYIEHWNLTSMTRLSVLPLENEMIIELAYSADCKTLAIGCRGGDIYLADLEEDKVDKLTNTARHGNRVQCLHWGNEGLYSIGWDGVLYLWDVKLKEPIYGHFCPCPNRDAVHFEPKHVIVGLVKTKNHLKFISLGKGEVLKSYTIYAGLDGDRKDCEIQFLQQARFNPSLFIVATSQVPTIKVIKIEGTNVTELFSYEKLTSPIQSIVTSSNKKKAFAYGADFQAFASLE